MADASASDAIRAGDTVYLDTNPIIYLTEGNTAFEQSLGAFFERVEATGARLVTSELALMEVLVRPLRERDDALIARYERLFDTLLDAMPVSREVLLLAAHLRAETKSLKTPDAIHIATASLAEADFFVSADSGIRTLPKGMRRIDL